jgi:Armadillo/beta-catenin-like repeat
VVERKQYTFAMTSADNMSSDDQVSVSSTDVNVDIGFDQRQKFRTASNFSRRHTTKDVDDSPSGHTSSSRNDNNCSDSDSLYCDDENSIDRHIRLIESSSTCEKSNERDRLDDSIGKSSNHSHTSGASNYKEEEKKDDQAQRADDDDAVAAVNVRPRNNRLLRKSTHHPWKTSEPASPQIQSPTSQRQVNDLQCSPNISADIPDIPLSPAVSCGNDELEALSSPKSPPLPILIPIVNDEDGKLTAVSSSETLVLIEDDVDVKSPSMIRTPTAQSSVGSVDDNIDDDVVQRDVYVVRPWIAESMHSSVNELSPVCEESSPVKNIMPSDQLDVSSVGINEEWPTLNNEEKAIDNDDRDTIVEHSHPPRPVALPRQESYVKRIVKNVEEHGSPAPGMKKVIPTVPVIQVQEGMVKTITDDVETWATRIPQYDKKGNLIEVEEGLVKTVVDDVEKRNYEVGAAISLEESGGSTHKRVVVLHKDEINVTQIDSPSMIKAAVSAESNMTTETYATAEEEFNMAHKHTTPKTKNTDCSSVSCDKNEDIHAEILCLPTSDDLAGISKYQKCESTSDEKQFPDLSNGDNDVSQPKFIVEATPMNNREVFLRNESFATPPPPPFSTAPHQIPNIQDTPLSVAKSVSFEDNGSVKSDLGSMVSNLSYPTNSGGSYMGQSSHHSPRMSSSSIGAISTGTPRSTGSKSRKRISDLIRRDLWAREENVVEQALLELADKAALASQYRNAIARSGGILAIVRAMEQNDSCSGIQVAACRALEKLALETENELAIGEVGGVDAVLAAMMQHVGNSHVQEAAWSALWNLTCGNACDEMTTDTEGGMHAIVACMKQHSDHPEVQRNACGALTNLCLQNDDRLRALADADGFVAIATALQNHWENDSVRKEASHALTALLEKTSDDVNGDDDTLVDDNKNNDDVSDSSD